jgi:hypothetical protein
VLRATGQARVQGLRRTLYGSPTPRLASVAQPCCTLDMVLRPLAVLLPDPSPLLDSGLTQLRRLLLDQLLLQRVSTRLLGRGRMSHLVKHLLHGM